MASENDDTKVDHGQQQLIGQEDEDNDQEMVQQFDYNTAIGEIAELALTDPLIKVVREVMDQMELVIIFKPDDSLHAANGQIAEFRSNLANEQKTFAKSEELLANAQSKAYEASEAYITALETVDVEDVVKQKADVRNKRAKKLVELLKAQLNTNKVRIKIWLSLGNINENNYALHEKGFKRDTSMMLDGDTPPPQQQAPWSNTVFIRGEPELSCGVINLLNNKSKIDQVTHVLIQALRLPYYVKILRRQHKSLSDNQVLGIIRKSLKYYGTLIANNLLDKITSPTAFINAFNNKIILSDPSILINVYEYLYNGINTFNDGYPKKAKLLKKHLDILFNKIRKLSIISNELQNNQIVQLNSKKLLITADKINNVIYKQLLNKSKAEKLAAIVDTFILKLLQINSNLVLNWFKSLLEENGLTKFIEHLAIYARYKKAKQNADLNVIDTGESLTLDELKLKFDKSLTPILEISFKQFLPLLECKKDIIECMETHLTLIKNILRFKQSSINLAENHQLTSMEFLTLSYLFLNILHKSNYVPTSQYASDLVDPDDEKSEIKKFKNKKRNKNDININKIPKKPEHVLILNKNQNPIQKFKTFDEFKGYCVEKQGTIYKPYWCQHCKYNSTHPTAGHNKQSPPYPYKPNNTTYINIIPTLKDGYETWTRIKFNPNKPSIPIPKTPKSNQLSSNPNTKPPKPIFKRQRGRGQPSRRRRGSRGRGRARGGYGRGNFKGGKDIENLIQNKIDKSISPINQKLDKLINSFNNNNKKQPRKSTDTPFL